MIDARDDIVIAIAAEFVFNAPHLLYHHLQQAAGLGFTGHLQQQLTGAGHGLKAPHPVALGTVQLWGGLAHQINR